MINIAGETLGFRSSAFSSELSLLMPALSLLYGPFRLTLKLHSVENAPLPSYVNYIEAIASVRGLSPVKFSAQRHLTSELLRTL